MAHAILQHGSSTDTLIQEFESKDHLSSYMFTTCAVPVRARSGYRSAEAEISYVRRVRIGNRKSGLEMLNQRAYIAHITR